MGRIDVSRSNTSCEPTPCWPPPAPATEFRLSFPFLPLHRSVQRAILAAVEATLGSDLDAVADLLTRGFVGRSRDYWMQGLRRQAVREVPSGYPRFGYMLDQDGQPVGVLLLLYTSRGNGGGEPHRYGCRRGEHETTGPEHQPGK